MTDVTLFFIETSSIYVMNRTLQWATEFGRLVRGIWQNVQLRPVFNDELIFHPTFIPNVSFTFSSFLEQLPYLERRFVNVITWFDYLAPVCALCFFFCSRSLRTVLSVWIETYPDDFREPLAYPTLNDILHFAQTVAVDNDLTQKTRDLLGYLRCQEDIETTESGLG